MITLIIVSINFTMIKMITALFNLRHLLRRASKIIVLNDPVKNMTEIPSIQSANNSIPVVIVLLLSVNRNALFAVPFLPFTHLSLRGCGLYNVTRSMTHQPQKSIKAVSEIFLKTLESLFEEKSPVT